MAPSLESPSFSYDLTYKGTRKNMLCGYILGVLMQTLLGTDTVVNFGVIQNYCLRTKKDMQAYQYKTKNDFSLIR